MFQDPNLIMVIFVLLVFSGIWLQGKVEIVRRLSAAMYCIFGGMILANIGIIPTWSAAHNAIFSYVVPFSIVMVLLTAKISDLKIAAPPALKAYLIHSFAAVIGFGLAALMFRRLIGPKVWKVAGVFVAGATGGTVNNIAAGRALGIEPGFFATILTAAMVGFTIYLFFIFTAPSWMPNFGFKAAYKTLDKGKAMEAYHNYWKGKSINFNGITIIFSVSIILTALSIFLKKSVLDIPVEIYVTTFAIIIANTTRISSIAGSEEIGSYGFHLFFAACGGMVDIAKLIKTGPLLLLMYLVALSIVVLISFFISKRLGINLESICIAGNAGVGGPTTAPVMAVSFGWEKLVLTGIILGVFGYALASYLGIATAYIIRALLF